MVILALVLGLYIGLFALPLIPGLIDSLVIRPNRHRPKIESQDIQARQYAKGTFGFFTYVFPGQVKIIERGGRFIRCIMAFDHHMFLGERADNNYTMFNAEYWEVVKTAPGYRDSHPIPFPHSKTLMGDLLWFTYFPLSIAWWLWKRWVYKTTGAVFTGLYWFQGPRIYPMERFRRVTLGNGEIDLVRKEDYSDHYRVAHFQYPTRINKSDTQDKIPVDVLLNVIAQVFNPYMVAYNTDDDWPTRFLGSISNEVTLFTRPRPLDDVWTAKTLAAAKEMAEMITLGGQRNLVDHSQDGSTCLFGIAILETQVLDISPSNPEDVKPLGDLAKAKVQRQSDEELALGKAAYIRAEGAALAEFPKSEIVVQAEALIRAAEAAGKNGGMVILGGSSIDPVQAAILQQLKKNGATV